MYHERATIAILGPARFSEGRTDKAEQLASALGATLALSGYGAVVIGAGATSVTASRGARQQGGAVLVVGGAGEEIAEATASEEVPTTLEALARVLDVADALMILPGDVRALALLTLVWSWGSEADAPYRPVILIGDGWRETVRILADAAQLDQKTRAMVTFAPDAAEAVEALRYYVAPTTG